MTDGPASASPASPAERFAGGGLTLEPGRIATLTLSAPERRNAIRQEMWAALPAICARIAADPAVRVVIVRGAGGHFSAGADIAEFPDAYRTAEAAGRTNAAVRAGQAAVAALPMPVLAEIRGSCVGGGCGLALSCDLRFAAEGARFGITPARLGLAYSFADTRQLVDLVGPARAKDILFSARLVGAAEALRIGLVDRVVAEETLAESVREYAETLSGLSQTSLRTAKATIEAIRRGTTAETPELRAAFEVSFAGQDFQEGYRAFLEKRQPDFG